MNIKYFGNDRQFNSFKTEWMSRAERVWSTGQFLNGPEVTALESQLATFCNRRFCVSLASCTDALTIAISFLNLPREAESIVTNYSFVASASPIIKNGLLPKFIDINKNHYHPMCEDYQREVSPYTKLILAVSLFGSLSDMEKTEEYCHLNNIFLIEDAAQSFGSQTSNRKAGSFGIASCISFDPTKILSGTSAGGALLTDNEELFEYAIMLRLHGRSKKGEFKALGGKSLLSNLNASLLSMKLSHLEQWISTRNQLANIYIHELEGVGDIILPHLIDNVSHSFHKFVIQTQKREELALYLKHNGIETRIHYPKSINEEPLFDKYTSHCENIYRVKKKVLSLPLYQELKEEELYYIISHIKEFFSR